MRTQLRILRGPIKTRDIMWLSMITALLWGHRKQTQNLGKLERQLARCTQEINKTLSEDGRYKAQPLRLSSGFHTHLP